MAAEVDKKDQKNGFPAVSKSDWLKKIEKDLKGKSLDSLQWSPVEGIPLDAIYHQEDLEQPVTPTGLHKPNNNWLIGETFSGQDATLLNAQIRKALLQGLEWVQLSGTASELSSTLSSLLQDIYLDYIHTQFRLADKEMAAFLTAFLHYLEKNNIAPDTLQGGVFSAAPITPLMLSNSKALLEELPNFRFLEISVALSEVNLVEQLADMLKQAVQLTEVLVQAGYPANSMLHRCQLVLNASTSFYINIAAVRAIKLLWKNWAAAYGWETISPFIIASIHPGSSEIDDNYYRIQSSAQATALVSAGVDALIIETPPKPIGEQEFDKRIARNVQHLLKMESHMDRVIDPAAGSYFFETFTLELAEKAWKRFQST